MVLNIIQSAPMNESLFIQKSGRSDDPYVAGISIAHYKKYKVGAPDSISGISRPSGLTVREWPEEFRIVAVAFLNE